MQPKQTGLGFFYGKNFGIMYSEIRPLRDCHAVGFGKDTLSGQGHTRPEP